MLFNSLQFLIFFPVVTLLYFLIPQRVKYIWLLAASYYFYMCWNPEYALLIAASTVVTYLSGIMIGRQRSEILKKLTVAASFTINLSILFYFKYFYFTMDNINAIRSMLHMTALTPKFDVILPVGISFYTFQALSYTVDVYRKDVEPEKNILKYALFVSFFPQLVAGPIERSKNLLKQVNEEHHFDYERVRCGLLVMLWGFFQKLVIADRAAVLVNTVYNDLGSFGGIMIAIATLAFALQIYCDFASYSLIAKGAARVMGFELMDNFLQPYFSTSISEFWRRWHISLSGWFRDYLYIPLGGNRKGSIRKYFNLMAVFLVSGLWHGASWHYVVWGAIHGVYQVVGGVTEKLRIKISDAFGINRERIQYRCFQGLITFMLVSFAWIFFRSADLPEAVFAIRSIFTDFRPWSVYDGGLLTMGLDAPNIMVLLAALAVLVCVSIFGKKGRSVYELEKMHLLARWPMYLILLFAVLIFGIYGPGYEASQFIYFQF